MNEIRDAIDNVAQKREMREAEIPLRHETDRKYVTMHSSRTWAEYFLNDLHEASEAARDVVRLGLSGGLGYRGLELEEFTILNSRTVVKAFHATKRNLLLFDYDETPTQIEPESSRLAHAWARPTEKVVQNLAKLSQLENRTVFILSGRTKDSD